MGDMENRFSVEKKNLLPLLSAFQPLCAKRTTLDATSHILFQGGNRELVLKGTDLEVSLQASCNVLEESATNVEAFLVQGRRIFDSIKEMDGTIECRIADNQLMMNAEGVDLRLTIKNVEEFPPFPERIENLMHIDAEDFMSMLNKTMFLIPQNNSNPALNGLFVEISPQGLSMTATDGHSLINLQTAKYTLDRNISWLLPRRAVFELKKLVETTECKMLFIGTCDNQMVFSGELFNFFTRLIAQPFPDYHPVLDRAGFSEGDVDRQQFLRSLRRAACLLSGNFLATKFFFRNNALGIRMENKGIGTLDESIPLNLPVTDEFEIRFFAPYLVEGLQVFTQPRARFFIKNSSRPIIFETEDDGATLRYLVMPVAQK